MEAKAAMLQNKEIRKTMYRNEWWFSVVDVCAAITDSPDAGAYWRELKQRLKQEGWESVTFCHGLKLPTPNGVMRETECANAEGIFRIIQSIPSPNAESFKRWLAKVGYEWVQGIEDPELASRRMRAIYRTKGYSGAWIEKRMRGIEVRAELTNEWKKRGVKEDPKHATLAAEISKAAFGMTPSEYKEFKGLGRENLRDHMSDLELIFSMLGEAATTEIARKKDTQGFNENKHAARKGGRIAGEAREKLEAETGNRVSRPENYLDEPEIRKRLKYNEGVKGLL